MKRYLLISTVILGFTFYSIRGNNIVIQDINEEFGLSRNRVNCMAQDSKGFLWFGLVNGLYKFDLNAFTKYKLRKNNISGFPESDVKAIVEITPGKLLIGANKGLFIFSIEKETYDTVNCKSTIPFSDIHVQSICVSDKNSVWIGSDRGLMNIIIKNRDNLEFELVRTFNTSNSGLISNKVQEIKKSPDGTIWFLTGVDMGFFNVSSQSISVFNTCGANTSIFIDSNIIIQSCYGGGIFIFNTENLTYENIHLNEQLRDTKIRYTHKDNAGKFWLSISNVGLLLMDSLTQEENIILISNKNDKYSKLNSDVIYEIYETDDGAIWLCTEEGINLITLKQAFFHTESYISKINQGFPIGVRALYNYNDCEFWIGSVGDGLFKYDFKTHSITNVPLLSQGNQIGLIIQAVIEDTEGNLWLGTEGDGVIRLYMDNNHQPTPGLINYRQFPNSFPENSINNDFVMCLLEDRNKNIWIGTWYGLSLFKNSELSKVDQAQAKVQNFLYHENDASTLSNNTIMSLLENDNGTIWVGTLAGINKIIPSNNTYRFESNFQNSQGESLTGKQILDLHQDLEGDIWFSTQDGGLSLLHVKTGIFEEYNSSNGFHDHIVNSISQDSLGILWLGTNNGLCRFDPKSYTFNMYYTEDGLLSNDFFYRSNCEAPDLLLFGGNKGITYFNPYDIIPSKIEPNLIFTNFKLFDEQVPVRQKKSPLNKHISFADEVTLKYNQNYITIEFADLNFKHQKEILYSCILEGLENSWNKLNHERKISYTNLKPGKYIFKVKSFTSGQKSNIAEISLPIHIKPPYWRTAFAYLTYIILITLIIIYSYRYFLNQEQKKHSLALERMNAKRIHELDMLKLQFYTNISHELRTPLTLISAPLELLISGNIDKDKTQSYYQLIHKNVQRLKRLITQLLDMRKIEAGHLKIEWSQGDVIDFIKRVYANFEILAEKRNINFTYQSSVESLNTFFDADKMEKIIFNLLSNAFKYTPDKGNVTISILKQDEATDTAIETTNYLIKISDTGYGIPQESIRDIYKPFHQIKKNKPIGSAGSGIGLSLTKELVELQNGEISVESKEGIGSVFTVKFPVVKEIPAVNAELQKNSEDISNDNDIDENSDEKKASVSKSLILIVEDDKDLRDFICGELGKNYTILESSNGKDGLKTAIESIPDMILSDVMMDEMDGIEMCKLIKDDIRTSHIPVILLTARYSEEIKQNSFKIGVDAYITKPFNTNLLQTRIRSLIKQRRNLRKLFGNSMDFDFSTIATNKTDAKFIDKLNTNIEENIDNLDFNPVALASEMAMSKMQLYRKVAAMTNQTVFNYIRTIRMNKAAQLLVSTDMQIAEVAYSVGFSEASNFTKTFSKHFNLTPSQFIKEQRN